MTVRKTKSYSVKPNRDGLSLKERYQRFREAKAQAVQEIERHDPNMAAAARRLLSVPNQARPPSKD